MTYKDVIKLAREASFVWEDLGLLDRLAFYEFANLVADAEREANIRAVRAVQAAYDKKLDGGPTVEGSVCSDCIGAIYARAEPA